MRFLADEAEKIICAAIFLAMTAIGFVNVFVRYATNWSIASTEELQTSGFLILTIFGAAIAARRGEHLAVTLVTDLLPRGLRRVVMGFTILLSVLLLGMSAWFSWQALANLYSNGMRSYALGIPAWYYQAAVPFGFALIVLRYLQHAVQALRDPDHVRRDVPDA